MDDIKKWYSTELAPIYAEEFKSYLKARDIEYEASECGMLIHFECNMTDKELMYANNFIDTMYEESDL